MMNKIVKHYIDHFPRPRTYQKDRRSGTIIFEDLPTFEEVSRSIINLCWGESLELDAKCGIARLKPGEQFEKRAGILVAQENLKPVKILITGFVVKKEYIRADTVIEGRRATFEFIQNKRPKLFAGEEDLCRLR